MKFVGYFLIILSLAFIFYLFAKRGISFSATKSSGSEASAESKKKGKQTTRGISWDDLGLGAAILWLVMLIGGLAYAGLWISNEYFPKEVMSLTYIPHWDEGKKTSAMCINVEPGVYEFSCSGRITSVSHEGTPYTMSCQHGNPPSKATVTWEVLSHVPLPDIRQYGRLFIANEQGRIAIVRQRLPVQNTLCINTNVEQTVKGTGDLEGNVHVALYKERFPWLP